MPSIVEPRTFYIYNKYAHIGTHKSTTYVQCSRAALIFRAEVSFASTRTYSTGANHMAGVHIMAILGQIKLGSRQYGFHGAHVASTCWFFIYIMIGAVFSICTYPRCIYIDKFLGLLDLRVDHDDPLWRVRPRTCRVPVIL